MSGALVVRRTCAALLAALLAAVPAAGFIAAPGQASAAAPAARTWVSGWVNIAPEMVPSHAPPEGVVRLSCTVSDTLQLSPCKGVSQSAGAVEMVALAVNLAATLGRFDLHPAPGAVAGARATVDFYFFLQPGLAPKGFMAVSFGPGEPPRPGAAAPQEPFKPGGGRDGADGGPKFLDIVERPTQEDFDRVFPPEADRQGVTGMVALVCIIALDGHLKDCEVAYESPQGFGFGEAALKLGHFYRTPTTFNGRSTVGAHYRFTIRMAPSKPAGTPV